MFVFIQYCQGPWKKKRKYKNKFFVLIDKILAKS